MAGQLGAKLVSDYQEELVTLVDEEHFQTALIAVEGIKIVDIDNIRKQMEQALVIQIVDESTILVVPVHLRRMVKDGATLFIGLAALNT